MIPPLTSPKSHATESHATETSEYSRKEAIAVLEFTVHRFSELASTGALTRTRRGYYSKESIDAYKADIDERKRVGKADWIDRGNLT